jgi:hypothetical protein
MVFRLIIFFFLLRGCLFTGFLSTGLVRLPDWNLVDDKAKIGCEVDLSVASSEGAQAKRESGRPDI